MLTLDAKPVREPPHRRVIEEKSLHRRLQKIDEVVVAAHVRKLVRQHGLKLFRRKPRDRAGRDENDRPQMSDDRRRFDERRTAQTHRALDAQAFRHASENLFEMSGDRHRAPSEPQHEQPPAGETQRERCDAREPRECKPGHERRQTLRRLLAKRCRRGRGRESVVKRRGPRIGVDTFFRAPALPRGVRPSSLRRRNLFAHEQTPRRACGEDSGQHGQREHQRERAARSRVADVRAGVSHER